MISVIFIICLATVIISILLIRKANAISSPLFWLFSSWALICGMYFLSGVEYKYALKWTGALYLAMCLSLFVILYLIGKKYPIYLRTNPLYKISKDIPVNIGFEFRILAIIGCAIYLEELLRMNAGRTLSEIHAYQNMSTFGVIAFLFSTITPLIWLYDLDDAIRNNKFINILSVINIALFLIPGIFIGGRQAILIIGIETVIVLFLRLSKYKDYKYKRVILISICIALVFAFAYFVGVMQERTTAAYRTKSFDKSFNSYTPPKIIEQIDDLGNFKSAYIELYQYYSHELPMFQLFYDHYDGPTTYGLFQLKYLSIESLGISYKVVWDHIDQMAKETGTSSHVWRTAIYQFIVDFGKIGTLIFAALLGYGTGRIKQKYDANDSTRNIVLLAFICTGLVFSIQYSPFYETGWAWPFYWMLIIPIIDKIVFRNKRGLYAKQGSGN